MFETKSPLDVHDGSAYSADSATGDRSTGPQMAIRARRSTDSSQPHSQNHKINRIPLYAPGGFFVCNLSILQAESMRGVELKRNKRGHITEAHMKPLTCHIVRYGDTPGYGEAFEQELASGRVYALRGVVGSR